MMRYFQQCHTLMHSEQLPQQRISQDPTLGVDIDIACQEQIVAGYIGPQHQRLAVAARASTCYWMEDENPPSPYIQRPAAPQRHQPRARKRTEMIRAV